MKFHKNRIHRLKVTNFIAVDLYQFQSNFSFFFCIASQVLFIKLLERVVISSKLKNVLLATLQNLHNLWPKDFVDYEILQVINHCFLYMFFLLVWLQISNICMKKKECTPRIVENFWIYLKQNYVQCSNFTLLIKFFNIGTIVV